MIIIARITNAQKTDGDKSITDQSSVAHLVVYNYLRLFEYRISLFSLCYGMKSSNRKKVDMNAVKSGNQGQGHSRRIALHILGKIDIGMCIPPMPGMQLSI